MSSPTLDGFETWPPEDQGEPTAAPSLQPYPDIPDIKAAVQRSERFFFGLPRHGLFDAIKAERKGRVAALARIVGQYSGYEDHSDDTSVRNAMIRANAACNKLGKIGTAGLVLAQENGKWATLRSQRAALNDPITQVLRVVESHVPPLPVAEMDQLVLDSLILFGDRVVAYRPPESAESQIA